MTPLQIDIVIWYGTRAVDYREGDFSAPAVRSCIDEFRDDLKLLEAILSEEREDHRTYRLTARGEAYLRALTDLPLPVCHWVIPQTSEGRS